MAYMSWKLINFVEVCSSVQFILDFRDASACESQFGNLTATYPEDHVESQEGCGSSAAAEPYLRDRPLAAPVSLGRN